jgi:hypothetical protein
VEKSIKAKLGLKLVTLAIAAASTAQAGMVIWGPTRFEVTNSGGGTNSGSGGGIALNDGSWLKLFGTGTNSFAITDLANVSGPVLFWNSVTNGASGTFTTDTLPISFSFTIADSLSNTSQAQPIDWMLLLNVYAEDANGFAWGQTTFTGTVAAGGGNVVGGGFINVPLGATLTDWQFSLQAIVPMAPGESVTITVPGNSIDINAPEPGGIPLAATAIAMLWWRRRRAR